MNKHRIVGNLFFALIAGMSLIPGILQAQKVGFVSSDEIRKNFIEAQQVEVRIKSMVENWKRQLDDLDFEIESLEFEIKKNRLVWTDTERKEKEMKLEALKKQRLVFAKEKFEPGGEYDKVVKEMKLPVETKIYAAIQEIAADEGYDIILDKSLHPIPYSNAKYDLTIKVLKKLGVDVKDLEKQLNENIAKDPRNKQADSKEAPKRRSRRRSVEDREIERETETPDSATPDNSKPPTVIHPEPNDKPLPVDEPPKENNPEESIPEPPDRLQFNLEKIYGKLF